MTEPTGDGQVEGRDGVPVGRRALLGALGVGGLGVLIGSAVQARLARALAPVAAKDPTGITGLVPGAGTFRI